MVVTGLSRWSFLSYQPRSVALPPLLVQVERDEFTDKLSRALENLSDRFQEVADRLGVSLLQPVIGSG